MSVPHFKFKFGLPKMAAIRALIAIALAIVVGLPHAVAATFVRVETNMATTTNYGALHIQLLDDPFPAGAPQTVANFLRYVNDSDNDNTSDGDYDNTIIHRSVPNFIVQGGGYTFPASASHITEYPPVQNEFDPSRSNLRGTMSMAKVGGDPNSATSEWFFNLGDNSANLDNQNGGFTVFGRVLDPGMDVVDAIAALPLIPPGIFSGFDEIPDNNGRFVALFRMCVNNDLDGACPAVEDLAPNGGDGNADGTLDSLQPNVTSRRNFFGRFVTFDGRPELRMDTTQGLDSVNTLALLASFAPPPQTTVRFDDGLYGLTVTETTTGVMNPAGEVVTLFDNIATRPTRYYAYVSNPQPHWVDFTFDGTTGAEIRSDRVVLHFVDGERGDDDGAINGSIKYVGGPAIEAAVPRPESNNDWGCSVATRPRPMLHGADWGVVFVFLAFMFARNRNWSVRCARPAIHFVKGIFDRPDVPVCRAHSRSLDALAKSRSNQL
jgi:cyclophilin family peptidyl-prolyl cis-trans isomerase